MITQVLKQWLMKSGSLSEIEQNPKPLIRSSCGTASSLWLGGLLPHLEGTGMSG